MKTDSLTGDVSLMTDVFSFLEEVTSGEKHWKNNYTINLELGRKERAEKCLEFSNWLRDIRFEIQKLFDAYKDDQTHCGNKHIFIAIKNLDEIGNRFFTSGDKENAKKIYDYKINMTNKLFELNNII